MIPNNKPLVLNAKYILFIAMLYVTISITADFIAYKYVLFMGFIESGATVIFPLTYMLSDVTCEVYGWNTAMKIVWFMLFCEFLCAILITVVIHLPNAPIGQYQHEYLNTMGNILLFVCAGIMANAISALLNIFFISKWKILIQGKHFWLRSIFATCLSELVLIFLVMLIGFTPSLHIKVTLKLFINAYVLEIIYAIIFVFPAQLLANFLKKQEGIDAYDYDVSYNPFKFI